MLLEHDDAKLATLTLNGLLSLGVNDPAPVIPFHCLNQIEPPLLGIH